MGPTGCPGGTKHKADGRQWQLADRGFRPVRLLVYTAPTAAECQYSTVRRVQHAPGRGPAGPMHAACKCPSCTARQSTALPTPVPVGRPACCPPVPPLLMMHLCMHPSAALWLRRSRAHHSQRTPLAKSQTLLECLCQNMATRCRCDEGAAGTCKPCRWCRSIHLSFTGSTRSLQGLAVA